MVICFLTCSPLDKDEHGNRGYRISASKLDFKRLNKQTVEAEQILNLVESFYVLGEMFKSPVPKNPYKCHAWIREIMKKYNALDCILFLHQGEYSWYKKRKDKPIKIRYDEEYTIQKDGSILYDGKIYPKYSLVLPKDNFFSMGFWHHPCVVMWLNYPDSLKLYINEHIREFIFRGGKEASIKRIHKLKKTVDEIEHPIWTMDGMIHCNHRASLLTKELTRKETPHYIKFRDFKVSYNLYVGKPGTVKSTSDFNHYIWPFSQDLENPRYEICENDILKAKGYSRSENLVVL